MHQYTLQAEQGGGEWGTVVSPWQLLSAAPLSSHSTPAPACSTFMSCSIQVKLTTAWTLHGLQILLGHVHLPHQGLSWGQWCIPAGSLETLLTSSFSSSLLSPGCRAEFCPPLPRLSPGSHLPSCGWGVQPSPALGPLTMWANPSLNSSSLTALSLRGCTTWGSWSTDCIDRALDLLQTNNFLVNVFIYKLYRPILKYLLGAVNKARNYYMKWIIGWSAHFWALASSEFVEYHRGF